jgi:hypothetical protein
MSLAGNTLAATMSVSFSGLPSGNAVYGTAYNVTINFTYTWNASNDKPDGGATVRFFEYDLGLPDDSYGTVTLSAPSAGLGTAVPRSTMFIWRTRRATTMQMMSWKSVPPSRSSLHT